MNREKGFGTANKSRYSNPALDAIVEQAISTVDSAKREALLQRGSKMALDDQALIPLRYRDRPEACTTPRTSATRRASQYTLANGVSKD